MNHIQTLNKKERREAIRYLIEENKKHGPTMKPMDVDLSRPSAKGVIAVWRSNRFMAQIFEAEHGAIRITVNRTMVDSEGAWIEGITWQELQAIKRQVGFGDRMAVEIFPEDSQIVNVANMRHIWVLPEPLPFAWRKP